MRMKNALIPTLRDIPAEAVIPSHQLLLKGGFIQKTAAGMYNYLPLGKRVLTKIERIVREEMDRCDAQEVLMPIVQPAELWSESGRWDAYGDEMWRVTDRHNRDFCLGPTHEEMITDLVRQSVNSYKELPIRLYQIQNKYRDERRPRFGLMRGREFIMKDLYSFDLDEEGLNECYDAMYGAYSKVFDRCGLKYRAVVADSGQIGGGFTHEFMVLADNGEATVAYCDICDYAANLEIAESNKILKWENSTIEKEKIATPNVKSINELANFLNVAIEQCVKTMTYLADGKFILALVNGNDEINEVKLQKIIGCKELALADGEVIAKYLGASVGSLGPIGIDKDISIYADYSLKGATNVIVGANINDYHIKHVNLDRDVVAINYADIRLILEGESCPHCTGKIAFAKGIEVGQIFKLGNKYSESMGATVLDENGKNKVLTMGCYGIGVSRTLAATVEQFHDDKGIIWPKELSPYQVHLVVVNAKDDQQLMMAERIYKNLMDHKIEVLFDDRKERVGVKFNDADLIGISLRVVVGKNSCESGQLEWKERTADSNELVDEIKLLEKINAYYSL